MSDLLVTDIIAAMDFISYTEMESYTYDFFYSMFEDENIEMSENYETPVTNIGHIPRSMQSECQNVCKIPKTTLRTGNTNSENDCSAEINSCCLTNEKFCSFRNEKERCRVSSLSSAYKELQYRIPLLRNHRKRVSKKHILQGAIRYIRELSKLIEESDKKRNETNKIWTR